MAQCGGVGDEALLSKPLDRDLDTDTLSYINPLTPIDFFLTLSTFTHLPKCLSQYLPYLHPHRTQQIWNLKRHLAPLPQKHQSFRMAGLRDGTISTKNGKLTHKMHATRIGAMIDAQ